MKTAEYWHKTEGSVVQCELCPHNCTISAGKKGICGVRKNRDGKLISLNYFVKSSCGVDPIEKKPLYHFFPGSSILSIGTFGCNCSCKFCQNYNISNEFPCSAIGKSNFSKEDILKTFVQNGKNLSSLCGLAYTYSEPTVWIETILSLGPAVREAGYKNVLVTNGYINPAPLDKILEFTDALNIDLKAMYDMFYQIQCGGELEPVLKTIKTASKRTHVELTTLVIPTLNDSSTHFIKLRDWIAGEIGENTPVHLSRYYPMYKFSIPPTPVETLDKAYDILKEKLNYVYIGNIAGEQDTYCANCGTLVIQRTGYATNLTALNQDGTCTECGEQVAAG